jgi:UDP-glucose:(heptosyl)LPS alpha-1,3-glucosyltransferase
VHVFAARIDPRLRRSKVARFHRLLGRGPTKALRAFMLFLSALLRVRRARFDVVVHMDRTGPRDVYRAGGGSHRTLYRLMLDHAADATARRRVAWSPFHRFAMWHERRALGRASVVVPSARAARDLRADYGAIADRVRVIPNGVDLDRFHPRCRKLFFAEQRRELGVSPEELVVVFMGSDPMRKGLDVAMRAVAVLGDTLPDLRLIGVGPVHPWTAPLAEELGIRDRVTLLPFHAAPEKLFGAADLLVLPTRHDPFANVTLEALASGVPVVTASPNGAAEVVGPTDAMRVVADPDDVTGIADAMTDLLAPARIGERRDAARAAAEKHDERFAVEAWERFLAEQAGARG